MALEKESFTFTSVIRGHHVYKETWMSYINYELTADLHVDKGNLFNRHATAVLKNGENVGHMPHMIA